ncbi:hypothetical protein BDV37DRAFT_244790 [Aspergillus pseudonomiae]|uniref:Uncharacterized protein n=1 Tax=Aspergillus pseudonomiae TaxID=1506151 RepID=A0A5N7DGJ8_9EURO|nr:uncharacterized protein BDV37DRAFT_244790 [Aspergillus pseudonomiae]KAE8405556.1 hypothetical protein BDV37DRAFT_244790 [Aspergillus pseudonomiae]
MRRKTLFQLADRQMKSRTQLKDPWNRYACPTAPRKSFKAGKRRCSRPKPYHAYDNSPRVSIRYRIVGQGNQPSTSHVCNAQKDRSAGYNTMVSKYTEDTAHQVRSTSEKVAGS